MLNVTNGTLNLKNGELRSHIREDLITKLVPIDYSPEATCPRWLQFLEQITDGDDDLTRFLQKSVGYSLTASIREQCFFILHGTGANGKSTFVNVVSALLGDYAIHTRSETLLIGRGDQIANDIARLDGARFVAAGEIELGRRLAEGLVKQMTGGDKLTGRFLYHEFFDFEPRFKLWLAVNHTPRVSGTDDAVWRRIRLVPFSVTIPEGRQDRDLEEKLKQELPGILAWAVEGCELWQTEGLKSPKAVAAATQAYRDDSDVIAAFIHEKCQTGRTCEISKADLYNAFVKWCLESGDDATSKREFGRCIAERGYKDDRKGDSRTRTWVGIKLKGD